MKILILLLAIGGLAYVGINHINWGAVTGGEGSLFKKENPYPFNRTLTNAKGQALDVIILGKSGDEVTVQRASDRKEFKFGPDKLSEADAEFIADLPEGYADLTPADVPWHDSYADALAESKSRQKPILMLFDGSSW